MPSYFVETFLARGATAERHVRDQRSGLAAKALTQEGTSVRFAGFIHVPEDEICIFTFEAPSDRVALVAAERAQLEPLRVVEAVLSIKSERSAAQPPPGRKRS